MANNKLGCKEQKVSSRPLLDRSKIPSNCLPLIDALVVDFPDFTFKTSRKFAFRYAKSAKTAKTTKSPASKAVKSTIFLGPPQPFFALQTLHELAHGLCGHKDWSTSVLRLKCEREAWERARGLFLKYKKLVPDPWSEDFIEASLDTYRDWLHAKTLCPRCHLTRFQSDDGAYHCPRCENLSLNP